MGGEELVEAASVAPVAGQSRHLSADDPGSRREEGLHVVAVDAAVSDEGVGEGDDLSVVGLVGEGLLITGHPSGENDLGPHLEVSPEGLPLVTRPIG